MMLLPAARQQATSALNKWRREMEKEEEETTRTWSKSLRSTLPLALGVFAARIFRTLFTCTRSCFVRFARPELNGVFANYEREAQQKGTNENSTGKSTFSGAAAESGA